MKKGTYGFKLRVADPSAGNTAHKTKEKCLQQISKKLDEYRRFQTAENAEQIQELIQDGIAYKGITEDEINKLCSPERQLEINRKLSAKNFSKTRN